MGPKRAIASGKRSHFEYVDVPDCFSLCRVLDSRAMARSFKLTLCEGAYAKERCVFPTTATADLRGKPWQINRRAGPTRAGHEETVYAVLTKILREGRGGRGGGGGGGGGLSVRIASQEDDTCYSCPLSPTFQETKHTSVSETHHAPFDALYRCVPNDAAPTLFSRE